MKKSSSSNSSNSSQQQSTRAQQGAQRQRSSSTSAAPSKRSEQASPSVKKGASASPQHQKQGGNHAPRPRRKTAREVALDVLVMVDKHRSYSNLQLNAALQEAELERVDAGLATELVYGTIQRLNTIDGVLQLKIAKGIDKLKPWMRNLLRMSLYQLQYLDRVPSHAAVNEAVAIAKRRGQQAMGGFVNGVLRAVMREPELWNAPQVDDAVKRIAWTHSHPEWLVSRWIEAYGQDAVRSMCEANNTAPHASGRVNRVRSTRDELLEELRANGIDAEPSMLSQDGIVAHQAGNFAFTSAYREGKLSVQDESSMLVVEAVRPQPGMRIVDCCAAPGGKSMHIAERMNNVGELISNDVHAHKVKLIEEQAARLGLSCIQTINMDAAELSKQLPEQSFDVVLLDAPCTGFGVIRRKPDLKWTKTASDVAAIAALQARLIREAAKLVKPGGRLVYSTCTIEHEENEDVIQTFMEEASRDQAWSLDDSWKSALDSSKLGAALARSSSGMLQVLPHDADSDGFFIACLQKQ
ncbi:16S rRNA (cytosine(967)-C(5))-methyltransferase RsmB [Paenibacillus sp. SC116]|nr:16S rRNA (cytosine(967)-C(5))-methyltransferase RsmB [Paenibacillus sp. SC116]MCR8845262.1 16S rRNA (cytosine(967)-C(5))-methyltransferase RsmB [Paenibacillus sp. SC116]